MENNNSNRKSVLAVYEKDLDDLLQEYDIYDKLKEEGIECEVCKCKVTLKNLGFIVFIGKNLKVCCDNFDCYYKFLNERRKKLED